MERIIYKTPAELDFYTLDYTLALPSDSISTSAWSASDATITLTSPVPSFSGLVTKAWIGGGTINGNIPAYVTNAVVTPVRQIDRAIKVIVRQYNLIPLVVVKQAGQDLLDYTLDWTSRLLNGTDTIAQSSFSSSDPGLSVTGQPSSIGNPATTTTVFLSGDITGRSCVVTNTVTTALGRKLEATFTVIGCANVLM